MTMAIEKFATLFTKKGCNQQGFAAAVGVSQSTVSRWATGDAMPNIRQFARLERAARKHGVRFRPEDFLPDVP